MYVARFACPVSSRTIDVSPWVVCAGTLGMTPIGFASGSPGLMIVDGAAYTVNSGVATFIVFSVIWYAIASIETVTTGSLATVLISGLSVLMSTGCQSAVRI